MFNPFIPIINQLLPEPHASLLIGMLFGVKTSLPVFLKEALITTGTIHLVALSGQNISILINLISRLTLPFGRRPSVLLSVTGIALFVYFVGPSVTVVRAALMGCMSLVAVYLGRQYWSLLSLLLSAAVILLFDRTLITDISFQLSFFATLGIITVSNTTGFVKTDLTSIFKEEVKSSLKVTLAAQIATLPVVFWHFRRLSLIAPVTNVLISWLITPVMILGILGSILGVVWKIPAIPFMWLIWALLSILIQIVVITSKMPFASITF